MKQYVIIGNGVAAAATIEGIRSRDSQGLITVVSKEKYPVYCCVYGHLHGKGIAVRFEGEHHGIQYMLTSCDASDFRLREIPLPGKAARVLLSNLPVSDGAADGRARLKGWQAAVWEFE